MNYGSVPNDKIYQTKPPFSKASTFRPKGWTDTVAGYINEAKQLTLCILRNRSAMKRPYTWAVHLNISDHLTPKQAADQWTKACRSLRLKGVIALWVREPNKSNKVHYHLIVKNEISKLQLERAIEESMPARTELKWRKRVEPIQNEFRLAHYLTKAKITGFIRGRHVADFHRTKRLLFKTNRAWKKYGVVGAFWERPKKKLWQEIRDIEKTIAEGLERPNVKRYAKFLFDLIDGYVPLRRIERNLGRFADDAVIKQQIQGKFGDS